MSLATRLHRIGLIRRKERWALSLRGWIALLVLSVLGVVASFRIIFPFLAVNEPLPCELLVVEGWIPDYGFDEVRTEFQRGGYKLLVITGNPITKGEPLAEYKTYPEVTRAILLKQGWNAEQVIAVPSAEAHRDRTFAAAMALRAWITNAQPTVRCVNVFSRGTHARRTRLLYLAALRGVVDVGIIAGMDLRYDRKRWWKSSEGVRDVIDETIAYFYARLIFRPD
jgi:hypothetical protein